MTFYNKNKTRISITKSFRANWNEVSSILESFQNAPLETWSKPQTQRNENSMTKWKYDVLEED